MRWNKMNQPAIYFSASGAYFLIIALDEGVSLNALEYAFES